MSDGRAWVSGRDRGRQSRLRRTGPVAVAFVVVGVLAAACGGGPASPRGSARPSETTLLLEFSACIRAHGLPDFPDPQSEAAGGGYPSGSLNPYFSSSTPGPRGQGLRPMPRPRLQSAEKACRSLAIASGFEQTPAELQQRVKQETAEDACLRKHGFPEMPDPGPQGQQVVPYDVNSPQFQAAQKRCAYLNPGSG
jgi:hypothetical protein